jgi:nucleotide-binding universal stress UspA family protein
LRKNDDGHCAPNGLEDQIDEGSRAMAWHVLVLTRGGPMPHPKIVLCAVDLTDLANREVELAGEICEAFGARLVLHHNVASVAPGLTRAWEWKEVHRDSRESAGEVEHRLRSLMGGLPRTFPVEASLTTGSLVPILLELAKRLPADLVVLGSHGWSTEEHTSVAERILDRSPCPVLTIHDPAVSSGSIRLRARPGHPPPEVVVPIDLTDAGPYVLDYAFDLARMLGLYLHVLHVEGVITSAAAHETHRRRLAEMVPAELVGRVECHLDVGDPVERIMAFLCERQPAYAIMGEHARHVVRRFLTHDTARELLHRAPCPVWFVPPR